MDCKLRVRCAKLYIQDQEPFLGAILQQLAVETIGSDHMLAKKIISAAVSENGVMVVNEGFVQRISDNELCATLLHEALHWALGFFDRMEAHSYNLKTWNTAHDYAINLIIEDTGKFSLKRIGLYDPRLKGMTGDEIYKILTSGGGPEGLRDIDQIGDDVSQSSSIDQWYVKENLPDTSMEEFQSEGEIRRKECLETAIFQNGCRSMDDLPGWVKKHVNASVFSSPKVLKSLPVFFGRHGGMDLPSRARRNRRNRFDGTHLPYPGRRPVKPRIYVICDTSGSMFFGQQALLSQALGMLVELQSRRNIPCTFIQCDAEISSIRDVDSNLVTEILSKKMTLKGSGGSNLTQAFDWAWEEGIRHCGVVPIICFTDGLVTVPVKPKCATDVLWILPENGKAPAKWGHFCTL